MRFRALLLLGVFAFVSGRAAATESVVGPAAVYLSRAEKFGFSGVVLIARGDEILLHHAYGMADRESATRLTKNSRFYVASISKVFTAAAILKLAEEGKLAVTDSIGLHLADVPPEKASITIASLLTHTSGLRDFKLAQSNSRLSRDRYVAKILERPLRDAGTAAYSNAGYSLLAAIVERAGGKPFPQYLNDELWEPAGLRQTSLIGQTAKTDHDAISYHGGLRQGDPSLKSHQPLGWQEWGAVGVITTASDLFMWDRQLRAPAVLSRASVLQMTEPQAPGRSYGWVIESTRLGTRLMWHDGLLMPEGWNAQFRRYLDDCFTVIVLSNVTHEQPLGWLAARAIDRALFGGDVPMPPFGSGTQSFDALAGTYRLSSGDRLVIHSENGALLIEPAGQAAVDTLFPPRDAKETAARTAAAAVVATALCSGNDTALEEALGNDAGKWRARWTDTTRELAPLFGTCASARAIHTMPSAQDRSFLETYVSFTFKNRDAVFRFVWIDGALVGISDQGAFIGEAQDVPVSPGAIPLVQAGSGRLRGWSLARGAGFDVVITPEGDIRIGDTIAKREREMSSHAAVNSASR